ncbi:ribokinase [Leptolyngbya cf. ectocarpi LEGE 11479]|uniref:Ribokinase n=1 Tax=Leptolyngbya cf. ectocarpi LEGE 11479 TaxID=1828722 RepID=A0A928ZU55_LEPEC|nr:ribokinase [Leptolyngbya ectocarpi]MBE9067511.1 ribokinase [Leptolyngbya cf. ectocarpi LEGE 11479]
MAVIVFGSLNMDLMAQVPRLPQAGETVLGTGFTTVPGGKGANQAVAAARLGVPTIMVGRVGDDSFGPLLCDSLRTVGVTTDGVLAGSGPSGVALISVDELGENQIVVVPGANGKVDTTDVERLPLDNALSEPSILLMQFEIPLEAVMAAAAQAHGADVCVIVDPAPAHPKLPSEFYRLVDILTPNQTEASQLTGLKVSSVTTAMEAAQVLRQRGTSTVIVKLGSQGAVVVSNSEVFHVPAFEVEAVDTVAAGDAFNGGLAVALWEGKSLREAVEWASAVAALSVMKSGAQPSMPPREAVETFLLGHSGSLLA